ncbi:MAG: hypothetical protein EA366_12515, partial [Spirulina sp. DLM2.Bin59]
MALKPTLAFQFPTVAPALKLATILLLLLGIGLGTVGDYGVSWDEGTEISTAKYNFEWITQGEKIPKDLRHDGVAFNLLAELAYQGKAFIDERLDNPWADQGLEEGDRAIAQAIHRRIQLKHPLTFVTAMIAYGAVAALVAMLTGFEYAWFGPLVLALIPRFWAHGFYNPKDIPFAALFTLTTAVGAALINYDIRPRPSPLSPNRFPIYVALYGVLIGVLCSIRIEGFLLLGFFPLAHVIAQGFRRGWWGMVVEALPSYLLMVITWGITTTLLHPAAWSNPLGWFWATLAYLSQTTWPGVVLFAGQILPADQVPRSYLPVWLWQTTPLLWQVGLGLGLLFIGINFRRFTPLQRGATVLVLLQIILLPGLAIAQGAPIYNGLRQFLFILPGVGAIAAAGLIWSYQQLVRGVQRFFALTGMTVAMSAIAVTMITLHPHQYVYFNWISGGLPAAYGRYDTDYWGLSLREAIEWVNDQASPGSTVAVGGPLYIAQMFTSPELTLLDIEADLDYGAKGSPPDYYVAMPYIELPFLFPQCPVVYAVERDGVPLSTV